MGVANLKKHDNNKQTIIELFKQLSILFETRDDSIKISRFTSVLDQGIKKVESEQQTPQLEVRAVYTNIMEYTFVDKIKLSKKEAKILQEINDFSHSKGVWGELNMLSTSNFWPSN
ncbi:hypothetical protein IV84_GL001759 [Pediococcus damnosus]|uniref:Pediocin immunity protein, PedB n=1 Tax=Pediococcus damnosus TaxID=51663 RepID=A0AAC9B2Y7_9LACO|nr:Pediocin immunity protein, PedB [Pediococcus damnosus]AMV69249.1 Pediocin immunity protein, PedB [Pediococcus damnosus]KRN53748.1 hypothetical protein IV84_GL001759 [Pediococcus damnosus]PIO85434.1 hypothetical protein BSQ37_05565 [Pediococcus damnosus]PJE49467.1 bacteriocin immunity protein [Pediococcus damnosus]